jgi:FKBP-type peptidyl-prolyl cis-trans isomerase SlyD
MKKGELILIDYVGKANGEVFDLTNREKAEQEGVGNPNMKYEPVPALLGEGYVIPGLEEELLDMEVGEERELTVPQEKAYGKRNSEDIETYPEREFTKQDVNVNVGERVMIGNRQGKVISKGSGRVRVDFNHPLSGKDLDYWVKVVEKVEDDEEIARHIFDYRLGHGEIEVEDGLVRIPNHHSHGDHVHELPEQLKESLKNEIKEYTDLEVEFFEPEDE